MKKILLIPALMLSVSAMAADYEITPVIGYNIAEGNLGIENQALVGIEAQYNGFESVLKPELSVLYTNAEYEDTDTSTNIYRIALNGVYEYEKLGFMTPLAKIGFGYETLNTHLVENEDSPFVDVGVGAKVPFTESIALKLEAVYMLKNNDNRWDNNLALLAGINIAFGASEQKAAPVAQEKPIVAEPVKEEVVAEAAVIVDGDDDKDGVLNSADACPTSNAGDKVDAKGCLVDGDDDQDGVLNSVDACPTSKAGEKVDASGCATLVNLHVKFDNAKYTVDAPSKVNIQKFANFLTTNTNYSAKIMGYTDSVGNAQNNQKLSQKRANIIKEMLVAKGVEATKIEAIGMGEAAPVATNDTAEGRAQNRRIEAELIKN